MVRDEIDKLTKDLDALLSGTARGEREETPDETIQRIRRQMENSRTAAAQGRSGPDPSSTEKPEESAAKAVVSQLDWEAIEENIKKRAQKPVGTSGAKYAGSVGGKAGKTAKECGRKKNAVKKTPGEEVPLGRKVHREDLTARTATAGDKGKTRQRIRMQEATVHKENRPDRGRSRKAARSWARPGDRLLTAFAMLSMMVLFVIAMGAIFLTWNPGGDERQMERDAVAGHMPGADYNNVHAQAGETEILFSINTNQAFAGDTGTGNLLFENPAENQKLVRLQICRLDNGESIYESGLIKPGYYIARETLDIVPEQGDYPCKAYVYGYKPDNYEYIGKVETDIIVSVLPSVNE